MEEEELQKIMNNAGIFFIKTDDMNKEIQNKTMFGVEIDIDTTVDFSDFLSHGLILTRITQRGQKYYIDITHDGETLSFKISSPIKDGYEKFFPNYDNISRIATTFPDLCWIHSEGTTSDNKEEVVTKYRSGYELGDLTWILPSKFVDDLVEVMHVLNQNLFEGILQESIVYGPYINNLKEL